MLFSDFGLAAELERAVADLGFDRPTPIQVDAIPPAREGRDVLACAMTGSGKTAAFVLPMLERLTARRPSRPHAIRSLVLAPTRELAAQIHDHVRDLARHLRVTSAVVFGGVAAGPQEAALRRGVDVLVATPGRLLDHLRQPWMSLEAIEILVLDEADRMLDMGFLPDIRRVLARLPKERQSLLFSATMPKEIVTLSREILRDPATIDVERPSAPAHGVEQSVWAVDGKRKADLLVELIRRRHIESAIVFTRTKHRANRLAALLAKCGIDCDRIHGNRSQAQRTKALASFKSGGFRFLVATDIAARGIDVEALSHVVNFDVPNVPEAYVHRVGRTARAEATGDAFTFVSPEEEVDLRAIERALGKRIPRRNLDGFDPRATTSSADPVPLRHAEPRPPSRWSRGPAPGAHAAARAPERRDPQRPRRRRRRAGTGSSSRVGGG